jgi:hypothetical protein
VALVRRTQGAESRRVRRLELALRGRDLLVECDAEVDRFEEALLRLLAAPQRETLRPSLITVIAAERSAQATTPLRLALHRRAAAGTRHSPGSVERTRPQL